MEDHGWMSLPHLPAPWVILTQETVYHSRACAYTGTRVEWLSLASLSSAEFWTGLGWNRWNLLPTSLGCTEHGTPTHPPSGRRRQPGPPQRLRSHHLEARGSPTHSQEHLSLKDVIVTNHKDLDSKSCYPFSHGGSSFAHQTLLPR